MPATAPMAVRAERRDITALRSRPCGSSVIVDLPADEWRDGIRCSARSQSRHDLAAVRVQRLAAEIAALVGGEEHEGANEIVGRAEAAEGQRGGVGALGVLRQRIEAGVDETRATALTRTPCGASSWASARVKVASPPLAAE